MSEARTKTVTFSVSKVSNLSLSIKKREKETVASKGRRMISDIRKMAKLHLVSTLKDPDFVHLWEIHWEK